MNPAQRALWYIESHLAEPMTLDEIAVISGVSRFHLVRAFAAATGLPVMRAVSCQSPSCSTASRKASVTRTELFEFWPETVR